MVVEKASLPDKGEVARLGSAEVSFIRFLSLLVE